MRAAPRVLAIRALVAACLFSVGANAQMAGRKDEEATGPPARSPVLVPPVLEHFVEAEYPAQAAKEGLEANVILTIEIDAEGNVVDVKVREPAGHGFDEAAVAAAKRFKFKPATKDGTPIPSRIPYRYGFTMKSPPAGTPPPPAPKTILAGSIVLGGAKAEDDVKLAGVRVVIKGPDGTTHEVTTDENGRFSVADLPPGKYTVSVAPEGYTPMTADEELSAGQETDVTYRLALPPQANEVVVRGERPPREVTKRTIENRELARIPGTNGDALRAIQNLPGVARPPGLAGLLIVRGSAPNDTQTFIDGTYVPIIYHFGGLSSVVPTEIIDKLDFYPGNFSAQYGRAMGGIVEVGISEAKQDGKYHGLVQADFIDARALLEGPIPGLKGWTFVAGARRSYVDLWLKPVLDAANAGVSTAPRYYDYQLFAETHPTQDSMFRVGFFGSGDALEFLIKNPISEDPAVGGDLAFHTAFWRAQALYRNQIDANVRFTGMLAAGVDDLAFNLGSLLFRLNSQPITNRLEVGYKMAPGVTVNVGADILYQPYDVVVRAPPPPRPGEPDPGPFAAKPLRELSSQSALFRPGAYLEWELVPHHRVRIIPGFRVDYTDDTKSWDASWRVNARYALVENYPKTTLKGGAGVFAQPPQPQESSNVFGTPTIHSNRSWHYSIGVEQDLAKQVDVSVEGFYKYLSNLVSRFPTADGSYQYGNQGSGYVVGSEVLLRYRPDQRFFGWLAYTLSRSVRRDAPGEPSHLFQYDQTHILTVLGSYRLGRGWEFGARFRLISGNLDTPCLTGIYNSAAGAYACVTGQPFSERLPMFHQLDLRVDKHWEYESWRLSTYLDLQNVYNRQNPEALTYNYNYTLSTYQTGLPIIPSLGVRGEFLAMPRLRSILAPLLLGAVPACGNAFDSQASIVGLRVLAVQIDTPYAKPGSTVHLRMLYWDGSPRAAKPDGTRRDVQILWIGGCFDPAGDLYYACYPQLAHTFGGLSGGGAPDPSLAKLLGTGDRFQLDVPADIISRRPPPTADNVAYGLSYVFWIACGGKVVPAGDGSDRTVFPIKCVDATTGADLGPDDYVIGYTPVYAYDAITNANPILNGTTWEGQPFPQTPDVFGTCTSSSCAPGTTCGSNGYCLPVVHPCTASSLTDCTSYKVKPIVDRRSQEIDLSAPPNPDGSRPQESIWVAYYATQGVFKNEVTLVNDSVKGWNDDYGNDWYPPNAAAPGNHEARIFSVVHDNRGGVSWWWQDVVIE